MKKTKKLTNSSSSKTAKPLIVIGSDHGGYLTKQALIASLSRFGYTLVDVGGFSKDDPDDYPDFAQQVAHAVAADAKAQTTTKSAKLAKSAKSAPASKLSSHIAMPTIGVLICGSGTGMAIAANKVKGVRAAVIYDEYSAKMARLDNDANVACLRGRGFSPAKDLALVRTFLTTPFSGLERHERRIQKIAKLEGK